MLFSTDVIVPARGAAVLSRRYRRVSFYVVPAKGCVSSRQALTMIAKRACGLLAAGLKGTVIAARSAGAQPAPEHVALVSGIACHIELRRQQLALCHSAVESGGTVRRSLRWLATQRIRIP